MVQLTQEELDLLKKILEKFEDEIAYEVKDGTDIISEGDSDNEDVHPTTPPGGTGKN